MPLRALTVILKERKRGKLRILQEKRESQKQNIPNPSPHSQGLLRDPWTTRRSNQSILKEISPEYSLEGLMLKLQLILRPPDAKNWLIGKDPDAGKDWRREEKGTTEDEMVGWHHRRDGREFEQAPELVLDREAFTVHGAANIPQWLNSTLSTPSTNHSINCTSLYWHKRALLK